MNTTFQHLGGSYSLRIVTCDLEKLIFEVRLQSPLTWYQKSPAEFFYIKKVISKVVAGLSMRV